MNLNQIRLFAAVAKHLNVTRTSQALHVTQSSISHQLARLQREFGTRLYKKVNNGIELTEAGRTFLSETTSILVQLDELKGKFATIPSANQQESLTIAVNNRLSAVKLSKIIATFKESHPTAHIAVRTANRRIVKSLVRNSQVDLALVTTSYPDGPTVALDSMDDLLARKGRKTFGHTGRTSLVIDAGKESRSSGAAMLNPIKRNGSNPNIVLNRQTLKSVKKAVREKMRTENTNQDAVDGATKRSAFTNVRLSAKPQNTSLIIYNSENTLSALAREFLLLLRHSRK